MERLKKLLEEKQRPKTTDGKSGCSTSKDNNDLRPDPKKPPPLLRDRRSGKDLEIHDTRACPVDRASLPADAIRYPDELVVVQDIFIKPNNIEFRREVFFAPAEQKFYRGPLPPGYDATTSGQTCGR